MNLLSRNPGSAPDSMYVSSEESSPNEHMIVGLYLSASEIPFDGVSMVFHWRLLVAYDCMLVC